MGLIDLSFLLVIGLAIGSFIGAATWREEHEISIAQGRSFCDNCRKMIHWYDNIPLISYLLLGGKCRNCNQKISPRYPVVEALVGFGFLLIGIFQNQIISKLPFLSQNILGLVFVLSIFGLLVGVLVTDLEEQIIPDNFTFILFLVTTLALLNSNGEFFYTHLFAAFFLATLLLLLNLITKGAGMGLGDVKFALVGGGLLGLQMGLIWFLVSFVLGATVGIILLFFKKAKLKHTIAFGPFLVVSLILVTFFGSIITRLLFNI